MEKSKTLMSFDKKQWLTTLCCIALVLVGRYVSPISALSVGGNTALSFMLALVICLLTNLVPVGLVALMAIGLLPVLGLTESLDVAAGMFGSTMFWFSVAGFAIATVMTVLPLSKRISLFILKIAPKSMNGVVSALFIATALLSAFMSNFSSAIVLTVIGKQLLDIYDSDSDKAQSKGALFIAIVMGAAIGGVVTPMGSGCMVIAKQFLIGAGYDIGFAQWILFGLPVAIVMFFVTQLVLSRFLKPVAVSEEKLRSYILKLEASLPKKWSVQEILAAVILVITLICWFLNFNMILIALLCSILLLFPGFGILGWTDYERETGWGTVMLIPALMVVVTILNQQGVLSWMVDGLMTIIPENSPAFLTIVIFGVFIAVVLVVMPSGPVLTTVMVPIMISLGQQIGVHPVALALSVAFFTTFGFIIPTETVALMVCDGGKNFAAKDLPKVGLPVSITAIIACAVWLPVCTSIFFK